MDGALTANVAFQDTLLASSGADNLYQDIHGVLGCD